MEAAELTKAQALQAFFSQFGRAYEEYSVPTGDGLPQLPYLTYSQITGAGWSDSIITVNLWARSPSLEDINLWADEISEAIGSGYILPCKDGAMHIRRGDPFAQNLDSGIRDVKRKVITLNIRNICT